MRTFKKNLLPDQIDSRIVEKLKRVETATIGHFMHSCFIDREIRASEITNRIAGTAVTLQLAANDSTLLHDVISDLRPGDILVIDRSGDTRHACWGGLITNAAVVTGISGAVIDGPVTDMLEILKHHFPMWSRDRSAVTTKLLTQSGAFNIPIVCGGVTVTPGDAILADESGVVVLVPEGAEAIADRALGMQEAEIDLITRLKSGERLGDITGASDMISQTT